MKGLMILSPTPTHFQIELVSTFTCCIRWLEALDCRDDTIDTLNLYVCACVHACVHACVMCVCDYMRQLSDRKVLETVVAICTQRGQTERDNVFRELIAIHIVTQSTCGTDNSVSVVLF